MSRLLLLVVLCGLSTSALARLAPADLRSLFRDSELIVVVAPAHLKRDTPGTRQMRAGSAVLHVVEVVRGTYAEPTLELRWSNEVHDQPISDLLSRYLLFLKRSKDGKWAPTRYGRSYYRMQHMRGLDTQWGFGVPVAASGMDPAEAKKLKLVRKAWLYDPFSRKDRKVDVIFASDVKRVSGALAK